MIEEFINKTMISVDQFVPRGKANESALEVLSKDAFQGRSHLNKLLICWNVSAETTEVYSKTESSVNITEIEDFIKKEIIIPAQVVPSGKEGG